MPVPSGRPSSARPVAALALAALLVLAGCGGGGSADATTTTPAASTTTTPTTTTASGDATPTPTTAADGPGAGFIAEHVAVLRERGSVTVRSNLSVERGGTRANQSLLARLDLDGGRALVHRDPLGGARSTVYLAANGSAYSRQTLSTGKTTLFGPRATRAPNVSAVLRHRALGLAANLSLEDRGRTTYRGVRGRLYRATNATAIGSGALADAGIDRSDVLGFDYALVVAEAGYAKYARYNLTYRTGEGAVTLVDRVRYRAVGDTAVPRPDWLRAAVRKARRPGPGDQVTATYVAETADGRVEQAITAEKGDQREGPGVGPTVSENPSFYNPTLNGTRVGPVVRLYWPESTTRVNVTVHYDDADVPGGNESGLTVAVFDREAGTFVSLAERGATVERHPGADAISVVIEDPSLLERYQGNTFLAMNLRLFRERAFGDG